MDDSAHDDGDGDVSPPPPEQLAALQVAVVAHSGHLKSISRAPARSWLAAQLDTEEGTALVRTSWSRRVAGCVSASPG